MSVRIIHGDCRTMLATLPDASVQMVCTSPPYYGLRDYQTGTWEGGDPDCDHRSPTMREGRNEARAKLAGSDATNAAQLLLAHRSECGKCGAIKRDAQIGLEASPGAYIAEMVAVFREVRRVLRGDGVMFLNLGDSYATSPPGNKPNTTALSSGLPNSIENQEMRRAAQAQTNKTKIGAKPKDLMMMPARVALALQADGWWLRSQLPWVKRSTMPESCTDRPTSAIEYVYLFTKSGASVYWVHRDKPGTRSQPNPDYRWVHHKTREEMSVMPADWDTHEHVRKLWRRINLWEGRDYFWDAAAVARKSVSDHPSGNGYKRDARLSYRDDNGARGNDEQWTGVGGTRNFRNSDLFFDSLNAPYGLICDADGNPLALDVNPAAYAESHFATFPPGLVEPLVKAGTSERGCCANCGAPWVRVVERGEPNKETTRGNQSWTAVTGQRDNSGGMPVREAITTGWLASCQCNAAVVPATVLDPFAGAFTSCLVADRLQRNAIGIELSEAYCRLARNRLVQDAGMFAELA